jgi:hypothetical protein
MPPALHRPHTTVNNPENLGDPVQIPLIHKRDDRVKPRARPAYGAPPVPPQARRKDMRRGLGCVLRLAIALMFIAILALLIVASFGVYQYFSIASTFQVSKICVRALHSSRRRVSLIEKAMCCMRFYDPECRSAHVCAAGKNLSLPDRSNDCY